MFFRKTWVVLVLVLAGVARAQALQPSLSPFPLEFKRTPGGFSGRDAEELQRDFVRLVRRSGVAVPDTASLEAVWKGLKRQDCEWEDECLRRLAVEAQTLYALYVSVSYSLEGTVVAAGRVVRDDGVAMGPAKVVEVVKPGAFKDVAREAVTQLLVQLGVGRLPPSRPAGAGEAAADAPKRVLDAREVAARPPEATRPEGAPPPPPPVVVEEAGPSGKKAAAWTLLGVGVASAVAGVVVYATAGGVRKTASGNILPEDVERLPEVQARQAAGLGVLAGGLVVGAVGAVLLGVTSAKAAPGVNVSVIPVDGGAVALVGGAFQ